MEQVLFRFQQFNEHSTIFISDRLNWLQLNSFDLESRRHFLHKYACASINFNSNHLELFVETMPFLKKVLRSNDGNFEQSDLKILLE